ncbi:MAG: ribonuclease P protein component [Actinomycetota bacterium]|nr:ribonuclease P protein component [Actinomycetota bacterium]
MVNFTTFKNSNHFLDLKKEENCLTEQGLKIYIEDSNEKLSRLAISLPKSEANAVKRNKFRRKIKEVVRGLEINNIFYIYIVGTKNATKLKYKELRNIIESHPKLK